MRAFAYERPTDLADAVALLAEHGPDARTSGRRHRPDHPTARRLDPAAASSSTSSASRSWTARSARATAHLRIGARTTMTDIAADARHPARLTRRSPRRPRSSGRSRSGTGRRSPATSATPRRRRTRRRRCSSTTPMVVAAGPAGDAADPDRRLLRPLRGHDAGSRRDRHAPSSCRADRRVAAPSTSGGRGDAATISPRSPWPARSAPTGRPGIALRQPRPAAAPRQRRDRPARRSGGADVDKMRRARGAVRRRQPVAAIDAREPRLPPGDAPRPRPAGGGDGDRAPGRGGGAAR